MIDSDTNDEGVAVTQGSSDGPHFYCGKRGQYSCRTCGDECGPMGCQCPSCRRWSLVNGATYRHPAAASTNTTLLSLGKS